MNDISAILAIACYLIAAGVSLAKHDLALALANLSGAVWAFLYVVKHGVRS